MGILNRAFADGIFPNTWKRGILVLVPKKDKPLESPSSYRPLCLLDAAGKLLEHMVLNRLLTEIDVGQGLSQRQFGFRRGMSTIDAVGMVVDIARKAAVVVNRKMKMCALITLDVKNAFNTAPRQGILEELEKMEISPDIIRMIRCFLQSRQISLEREEGSDAIPVSSGVPQGSILGPTLWNILYNGVLELELPDDVTTIAYADDLAVVVVARGEQELMAKANWAVEEISDWISRKGMLLAPEKTEAVLLTPRRKFTPISFKIENIDVRPHTAIKYLGVWLDTKLTFSEHIKRTTEKASKLVAALSRLMPNVGGPRHSKRKVLCSVAHSIVLYAAPVWETAMKTARTRRKLETINRKVAIRVCSAYRTISADAVAVIAGCPPLDLLVSERKEIHLGTDKNIARKNLLERWQLRWENTEKGLWTRTLIPDIGAWVDRDHGETDFFLTQAISGHGCYRAYLKRFGLIDDPSCTYCGDNDDAGHTLFQCPRWTDIREDCCRRVDAELTPTNMISLMLSTEERWRIIAHAARKILETKRTEARSL